MGACFRRAEGPRTAGVHVRGGLKFLAEAVRGEGWGCFEGVLKAGRGDRAPGPAPCPSPPDHRHLGGNAPKIPVTDV